LPFYRNHEPFLVLNYLKQKHLVNLAPNILNHLEQLYFEGHNIVATEILSKYDLSQKEIKEISELIENKTASQIKIKQGKDDRLIGGAIIRYKDKIIDLSLKNQLNSLTKQLNT